MKARAQAKPTASREDWRVTNPGYEYSPPCQVEIDGVKCVELDGGVCSDIAQHGNPRGKD